MVSSRFLRFAVAGAVGFVVDASILLLLTTGLGASPFLGRAVSFTLALTVTWVINRRWAFAGRAQTGWLAIGVEYLNYGAVQMAGGVVNLAVFALTLTLIGEAAALQVAAVAAGAVAGMLVNYLGNRALVFRADDDASRARGLAMAGLWTLLAAGVLIAAARFRG